MSGFDSDWLDARAVVDEAARSDALAARFLGAVQARSPVIADLGCGTGNNAVFLEGVAKTLAVWRLIDGDAELLTVARGRNPGARAETRLADLSDPEALAAALEGAAAVTCSALLDLVSKQWLMALTGLVASARIPVLAALTYDGRMEFTPAHPADAAVTAAFNRHQQGDKGFGPSLGPTAPAAFEALLVRAGFDVESVASDWHLDAAAGGAAVLAPLIDGIAEAAADAGEAEAADIWYRGRQGDLEKSRLQATIGHRDILGISSPRSAPEGEDLA